MGLHRVVMCRCGKRGFESAKAAKVVSSKNPHDLRVYRCPEDKRWLHVAKRHKWTKKQRDSGAEMRRTRRRGRAAIRRSWAREEGGCDERR